MNKGGSGRRRNQVFIQVPRRDSLNLLLGYLLGEVDSIFRSVSFPAKDRLVLEKYNIHVRNVEIVSKLSLNEEGNYSNYLAVDLALTFARIVRIRYVTMRSQEGENKRKKGGVSLEGINFIVTGRGRNKIGRSDNTACQLLSISPGDN